MKYLASDPIYVQSFDSIDHEKGIIKGVKVCSEGDAKGHGVYLNKQFVRDVAKFGKEQTVGVKARFGHPNMCDTTLGTYIGRFKNFRTTGNPDENYEELGKPRKSGNRLHAVADLFLDETAKQLPKLGNAFEYITSLADSSPDMFGSSIVFHSGPTEYLEWEDSDGIKHSRNDASIESLLATDLVDSPAATDGLFSEFSTDEVAVQVTTFLDQHPEVYQLALANPEIVDKFMAKYADYKEKQPIENNTQIFNIMKKELKELKDGFEGLKTWFNDTFKKEGSEEVNIPEDAQEKLNEIETQITELGDQDEKITTLEASIETIEGERDEALGVIETSKATISGLESDLAKAKGASTKVDGKTGFEDSDEPKDKAAHMLARDLESIKAEL